MSVEDFCGDWVVQLLRLAFGFVDYFSSTSSGYRPDSILDCGVHASTLLLHHEEDDHRGAERVFV